MQQQYDYLKWIQQQLGSSFMYFLPFSTSLMQLSTLITGDGLKKHKIKSQFTLMQTLDLIDSLF